MKFLLDHDVYYVTCRFLVDLGLDVITVKEIGCAQTSDSDLLQEAASRNRIFVTRDRDFGSLVFVQKLGAGVIYLRIPPPVINEVHDELRRVLERYSDKELKNAFVVIEPNRHRFRKIK